MKPLDYRHFRPILGFRNHQVAPLLCRLLTCFMLVLSLTRPVEALPKHLATLHDLPRYTYQVQAVLPHDPEAFTQGFLYHHGYFYESTGLYGQSSLRRVIPSTGAIDQIVYLPERYFGEGLTLFNDTLIQLTWREKTAFVYHLDDFSLLNRFSLNFEGWGLTTDGTHLIAGDGSSQLYFLDPADFSIIKTLTVTAGDVPIKHLNELEYIDGLIYANVWYEDVLLKIDPSSGQVTGWVDLTGLADPFRLSNDVLNGIAYDPARDRLFVTGKRWPSVYQVRIVQFP